MEPIKQHLVTEEPDDSRCSVGVGSVKQVSSSQHNDINMDAGLPPLQSTGPLSTGLLCLYKQSTKVSLVLLYGIRYFSHIFKNSKKELVLRVSAYMPTSFILTEVISFISASMSQQSQLTEACWKSST